MPRLLRHPTVWLIAFLVWFGTLWLLSSVNHPPIPMPPIADFDKVEHFGYFFCGAVLFSAFLYRKRPKPPSWWSILTTVVILLALIGALDEFHQSFVPGRSGNDPFDWLADLTGSICGALFFNVIHRRLKWDS